MLLAEINLFLNSVSINIVDNLLNTSRCTLSLVFGAAIINNRLTGLPSSASYSTPFGTTIATKPGSVTQSPLPCGIAIPSPTPVLPSSSLFNTSSVYAFKSVILPVFSINFVILLIISFLSFAFTLSSIPSLLNKSVILIFFLLF